MPPLIQLHPCRSSVQGWRTPTAMSPITLGSPRECRNNWDGESPVRISCDHNHKPENTPGFIIPNTISLKDWNSTTLDSVPYLAMLSFSRRERLLQNPKMLKLPTTIASVMSNPNWASENIYQYPKTETMLYKVYKKMIMFTEKG